jgi:hypothetical protein
LLLDHGPFELPDGLVSDRLHVRRVFDHVLRLELDLFRVEPATGREKRAKLCA